MYLLIKHDCALKTCLCVFILSVISACGSGADTDPAEPIKQAAQSVNSAEVSNALSTEATVQTVSSTNSALVESPGAHAESLLTALAQIPDVETLETETLQTAQAPSVSEAVIETVSQLNASSAVAVEEQPVVLQAVIDPSAVDEQTNAEQSKTENEIQLAETTPSIQTPIEGSVTTAEILLVPETEGFATSETQNEGSTAKLGMTSVQAQPTEGFVSVSAESKVTESVPASSESVDVSETADTTNIDLASSEIESISLEAEQPSGIQTNEVAASSASDAPSSTMETAVEVDVDVDVVLSEQVEELEAIAEADIVTEPAPEISSALPLTQSSLIESRSLSIGQNVGDVEKLLVDLPVSKSQLNVQQTPLDTEHGYLYTINIEHGPDGDTDNTELRTVLRQGIQLQDGSWSWSESLIEERTVYDIWHTAPSVSADNNGYVHVVYNMHNMPWQYKRSVQPHLIEDMTFRGQYLSQGDIDRWKYENKTWFPTNGTSEIPGNQVTYPQFKKDNNRDLYLTYRFAAKPAATWVDRTMSGGISKYNVADSTWSAIGGVVSASSSDYEYHVDAPNTAIAFAAEKGWTVYHPRLMFGADNQPHVSLLWRTGTAGAELSHPCYFATNDGLNYTNALGEYIELPVSINQCSNLGYDNDTQFYSIGNSAMDSGGKPHILLSPIGGARQILSYTDSTGWTREDAPYSATEIFFDQNDTLWAVSSGIRILKREKNSSNWELMYTDTNASNCYPKSTVNADKTIAFIHTQSCDERSVTVYGVKLE